MRYQGQVYRPPSEARSLIIQVTYGCSHNTCAFCSMYKGQPFRLRPLEEVVEDLQMARGHYPNVKRIFLADGDALVRKVEELALILDTIATLFPECQRVSSYASPSSLAVHTDEELRQLQQKGLTLLYMGLESGCNQVLKGMKKGHLSQEIIQMGQKARRNGFQLSVTAITGLGGSEHLTSHAVETAKALNEMNPEYISLLTLMVEPSTPLYRWVEEGSFSLLTHSEMLEETRLLIANLDSPNSIFRMNHASNYLTLSGTLNQDKESMLAQIDQAQKNHKLLRPEHWRSL